MPPWNFFRPTPRPYGLKSLGAVSLGEMLLCSRRAGSPWSQASPASRRFRLASIARMHQGLEYKDQKFAHISIDADHQFAQTPLSYAFVNLKPLVLGHVLCSPKRVAPRFADLSQEEVADLWQLAQSIGKVLERNLKGTALTFAVQDGADAGQSIPHVHIHILPRRSGDFQRNDDIYEMLDRSDHSSAEDRLDMDKERPPRSAEELAEEALRFRDWF